MATQLCTVINVYETAQSNQEARDKFSGRWEVEPEGGWF